MDSVNIIIPQIPTTAIAGSDQNLPCGTTITTLAANAPVSGTGAWTIISGTGGSFGNPALETSSFSGVSGETYVLVWTINAGSCSSSDSVTILIPGSQVTISNAGPDQTSAVMCGLISTTLNANVATNGTGSWIILSGTGGSFGNASSESTSFSGISGQTYTLQWSITDGTCTSVDSLIVSFLVSPTPASAGIDDTLSCGVITTTLNGNPALIGTGAWNIISGSGGSLTNASFESSGLNGIAGQTYVLTWTITNGPCISVDTVNILFPAQPTVANAGSDQTLLCGNITATLAANAPVTGSGTWTIISGTGGSVNPVNSGSGILTGIPNETYVLVWTIASALCSSSDTVTIVIPPGSVTTANAGPDQTSSSLCGTTTTTLSANLAVTGNGFWTILSGTGGWFADSSLTNSGFTGIPGQTYVLQWTIADGLCQSTDIVIIEFPVNPSIANAGIDTTLPCGTTLTIFTANAPTSGTGMWSQVAGPNPVVITMPASENSPVTGLTQGTYVFVWTVSNAPCPSSPDTLQIIVSDCVDDPDLFDIPAGFSPNGDGINDFFEIVGIQMYPNNKVTIFNRWGNIVYEGAGYNNNSIRWDGTNQGTPNTGTGLVPEGTYFYMIDLGNGSPVLSGYVFVNRD